MQCSRSLLTPISVLLVCVPPSYDSVFCSPEEAKRQAKVTARAGSAVFLSLRGAAPLKNAKANQVEKAGCSAG